MEKAAERETHDFLKVDSFSQLPFIRPAPVKEKGIRLFGKEFGGRGGDATTAGEESESTETNEEIAEKEKESNVDNTSRRFECHYCCRNFPTSQALGGHQNAHKRERQHAKRAHLQSAMTHGSISDAYTYGLVNYRLGSATHPAMTYPSWSNTTSSTSSRFYGSHSLYSHQPPINGSPLGLWRIPASQNHSTFSRDRSLNPLPLFSSEELKPTAQVGGSSSQSRYVYDSKSNGHDHVSLDLHL